MSDKQKVDWRRAAQAYKAYCEDRRLNHGAAYFARLDDEFLTILLDRNPTVFELVMLWEATEEIERKERA